MAPELPGALDVIASLAARGVVVSTGRSVTTYDEAVAGFDAGARYGTHLFNAMPSLGHRKPGLPGALLFDGRINGGFIADSVLTHRSIIDLGLADSWARADQPGDRRDGGVGMPPGTHRLGDYDVNVDATSAPVADGTLAGSILELDQALRNLVEITGCTLDEALETMTTTPAKLLGIEERARPGRTRFRRGHNDLVARSAGADDHRLWRGGVYPPRPDDGHRGRLSSPPPARRRSIDVHAMIGGRMAFFVNGRHAFPGCGFKG